MKSFKRVILVTLIVASTVLNGYYYDDFEDLQPRAETAVDPSVQVKLSIVAVMLASHLKSYVLGGYYGSSKLKEGADNSIKFLISDSMELFRPIFGDVWLENVKALAMKYLKSLYAFSDCQNAEDEEKAIQAMNDNLFALFVPFRDAALAQGRSEIIPEESILEICNRAVRAIIITGRRGEVALMSDIYVINEVEILTKFAVRLTQLES